MNYENLKKKFNSLTLESEDRWDYRGKENSEKDYVHGFCTYPAMMVPKMQREMLDVYLEDTKKEDVYILDPFAGAGTILVEGMLRGLNVVGVDINPLAILLCKAKTTIILPELLEESAKELTCDVANIKKTESYFFKGIQKWFTDKAIDDLSIIRESIKRESDVKLRRFYWAAFCEVVRFVSNSRNCTYKLHIKAAEDIISYNIDARKLFCETLRNNIEHYKIFYKTLQSKNFLSADGRSYKCSVDIVLGDCIDYLTHSEKQYDAVFTSPPYGDNHTTVSYGQYSILPLRWINCTDIDESFNEELLKTQCAIDNVSLGGKKSVSEDIVIKLSEKSPTFCKEIQQIQETAPKQVAKVVSFYNDFDRFLATLSKRMKSDSISVWTVGNRRVAQKEISMNTILEELGRQYNFSMLTSFTRKIPQKRLPEFGAYGGSDKGIQETMTREHILIFVGGENNGNTSANII